MMIQIPQRFYPLSLLAFVFLNKYIFFKPEPCPNCAISILHFVNLQIRETHGYGRLTLGAHEKA